MTDHQAVRAGGPRSDRWVECVRCRKALYIVPTPGNYQWASNDADGVNCRGGGLDSPPPPDCTVCEYGCDCDGA